MNNRPVPGVQPASREPGPSCPVAEPPVAIGRVTTGGVVPEGGLGLEGAVAGQEDGKPEQQSGICQDPCRDWPEWSIEPSPITDLELERIREVWDSPETRGPIVVSPDMAKRMTDQITRAILGDEIVRLSRPMCACVRVWMRSADQEDLC